MNAAIELHCVPRDEELGKYLDVALYHLVQPTDGLIQRSWAELPEVLGAKEGSGLPGSSGATRSPANLPEPCQIREH